MTTFTLEAVNAVKRNDEIVGYKTTYRSSNILEANVDIFFWVGDKIPTTIENPISIKVDLNATYVRRV